MDHAIKRIGSSRATHYRYVIYVLIFMVGVINYWDRAVLSVALPTLTREFHMTPVAAGYLLSAFVLTYAILQLPAGMLLDRYGSRRTGSFSLALWSLATVATSAVTGVLGLFVTRLVLGVGEAATMPLSARTVREWAPVRDRAGVQAFAHSGLPVGTAVASIAVGAMVAILGWRTAFVVSGALGIIWAIAWFAFYETPQHSSRANDDERALIDRERPAGAASTRQDAMAGLRLLLRSRTVWGLLLTQGCVNYVNYFLLSWLPSYFVRAYGINVMHSGQATGIVYFGAAVLMVALGIVSDLVLRGKRVEQGARRYVVTLVALAGSVVGLTPLVHNHGAQIAIMAVATGCVLSVFANNVSLANDLLADDRYIGTAVGWLQFGGNLFGLAAPVVTGYLVERTGGYTAAFATAGVFLLAGALACLLMTRLPVTPTTNRVPQQA